MSVYPRYLQLRVAELEARLAKAERDSDALRQVRRLLKNGATISATGDGPVLEMVDGVFIGGCTIKFDKARPADSAPAAHPCIHAECPEPHWCQVEGKCLGPMWKADNERRLVESEGRCPECLQAPFGGYEWHKSGCTRQTVATAAHRMMDKP